MTRFPPISAVQVSLQPVLVNVNISVEGDANAETVDALRRYGDDFAERVREVIEDIEEDRKRGEYR